MTAQARMTRTVTKTRAVAAILMLAACLAARLAPAGQLEVKVVDGESGELLAARMHLRNAKGKPVKPPRVPYWHDHFAFDGRILLDLPNGNYEFDLERGPEYRVVSGYFTIDPGANDSKVVELKRFVNMKKEGWYSGDLHIRRAPQDVPLLMLADDLHIAPVATWWNDKDEYQGKTPPKELLVEVSPQRFMHVRAGEDDRGGGGLLYFNLPEPLPLAGAAREYPSAVDFLKQAKRDHADVHVDAARPFGWDLPVWVASRRLDSVSIAHAHLQRDAMLMNEGGGKPRVVAQYPNPHGVGRWSLDIYSHLLNCGLRLPPSAGSASGLVPNPLGYNRVYVHVDGELTWDKWWEGLRAGRSVVTNGPMLRPRVNGELPGYTFQAYPGEQVELNIALNLSLREKVDYLEIVKDGQIAHEVRLDEWAKKKGELPTIAFDRSGWLVIRAVTNHPKTLRFAMSAPYYVLIGDQPRISRRSAQFFLDWLDQRIEKLPLDNPDQRAAVLRYHKAARDFFEKIRDKANVD